MTLVSENGPQFKSQESKECLDWLGVVHKHRAPYMPSSNGQSERFVQAVKLALKASSEKSLQARLDKFLLAYRNAPHALTGVTPAVRFLGRQLRTRLDCETR